MLGIVAALLLLEPDFGTTVVIGCLTFALLFIAGARVAYLASGAALAAPIAAFLVWHSRYRLQRIRELSGRDLNDVDARFNLHVATRAWQILRPSF